MAHLDTILTVLIVAGAVAWAGRSLWRSVRPRRKQPAAAPGPACGCGCSGCALGTAARRTPAQSGTARNPAGPACPPGRG
ncbi:MAG TPA: FeoB-associated Cys-rich membrane protein [Candidatus Krumholzibacteria bacterium]|nr:FeoB-associated Cys-rich membrane protein [Candidatus Krumholzibacteria bacterium]HPD72986.1 FeoB-associated Cys-rich membrane protein [Candidatus Krumholzibacteria bacterium]HRY41785.1 FeoB-associated Cys-rich membrane protein [Candidatus Krumholzibacteria bacterium]